ncbi:S-adenosyl-L-methionine-dependent methyltransferases superfamily protein [Tanacetum coccineum]
MQRDMEKAKEQLINIMCSLEQIYPLAFFDVMIHLVMHLPEEAILGGPVYIRSVRKRGRTTLVNGVKFLVHDRDIHRTTQNSGVATPGPNGDMFYGQLEEILELTYIGNRKVVLFRCKCTNDESTEVDALPDNEVADEEGADFIGDEDDVVPHVLEDDDQDDDVRDDDDPASVHVVSSDDSSEDEN